MIVARPHWNDVVRGIIPKWPCFKVVKNIYNAPRQHKNKNMFRGRAISASARPATLFAALRCYILQMERRRQPPMRASTRLGIDRGTLSFLRKPWSIYGLESCVTHLKFWQVCIIALFFWWFETIMYISVDIDTSNACCMLINRICWATWTVVPNAEFFQ